MQSVRNTAITASAGTGKTFQLAHRYINLLLADVPPARICALTFSRKAAGEIFESIVRNLCEAASSDSKVRQIEAVTGRESGGRAAFLGCLRNFLHDLHSLKIGTLDSFLIGVVRAFPVELGVAPDFRVFDNEGAAAQLMRQKVLAGILNPSLVGIRAERRFLEAFKQATFGYEEKDMGRNLDRFISAMKSYYDLAPDSRRWGNEDLIWPQGKQWQEKTRELGQAEETVKEWTKNLQAPGKMIEGLEKIVDFAANYNTSSLWDSSVENVIFEQLMSLIASLKRESVDLHYNRKEYHVPGRISGSLFKLFSNIMRVEIDRCINQTRGLHKVLDYYSRAYRAVALAAGNLTFDDAQHLLSRGESGGMQISRTADALNRLYIDYRLNCRLDHWLLDEFQDTSNLQWNALANLADEVIQDSTGERSFFYVGDVKQAIYGWRGGNHKLFRRLLDRFGGNIKQIPLTESFRSAQPVIDTVNTVFGNLESDGLPGEAVEEWNMNWSRHSSNTQHVPETGYSCMLTVPGKKDRDESRASLYQSVAALIGETGPLERGLSVAVLVRTNKEGKELVNILRSECPEVPVVNEGKAAIRDNAVVELILALVKIAAHPGDSAAWRHIEMSPLAEVLRERGFTKANAALKLQNMIHNEGFRRFVLHWSSVLRETVQLDDFAHLRIEDINVAAGEFDASHDPDCNAFLRFIDNYTRHEEATVSAVRVMTFHQAKGLDFDVVILPDLLGNALFRPKLQELLVGGRQEVPDWLLKMPRNVIAEGDPVLREAIEAERARRCYGELCTLYVGLTRAKRALYMLTLQNAGENTAGAFLCRRLSGKAGVDDSVRARIGEHEFAIVYETGKRDWYDELPPAEPERAVVGQNRDKPVNIGKRKLERVEPSRSEESAADVSFVFDTRRRRSMEIGAAMHALFEKVEWIEDFDEDAAVGQWLKEEKRPDHVVEAVVSEFRAALRARAVREVLQKGQGRRSLWREKRFELLLGNKLIAGAFDRVAISYDRSGGISDATIVDFKSDRIDEAADPAETAAKYWSQLDAYEKALQKILGIPGSLISLKLVFTHAAQVVDLKTGPARCARLSQN